MPLIFYGKDGSTGEGEDIPFFGYHRGKIPVFEGKSSQGRAAVLKTAEAGVPRFHPGSPAPFSFHDNPKGWFSGAFQRTSLFLYAWVWKDPSENATAVPERIPEGKKGRRDSRRRLQTPAGKRPLISISGREYSFQKQIICLKTKYLHCRDCRKHSAFFLRCPYSPANCFPLF